MHANRQILTQTHQLLIGAAAIGNQHPFCGNRENNLKMKTILVVEDLLAVQQFLRETLESKGYETLGASSGMKAYEMLANHAQQVNLVLTDYHMPDGSGLDLITKIKENPAIEGVPVIFLTSETSPDIIKRAQQIGFNSWIKKPYRSDVLLKQIEIALQQ
jgi:two-component system, chemotaxis family, chemotaxis protein CheY